METRDFILIASAIIVVAGWFINGILNRKHEIAKKRMEYRLEMLHSFLPIYLSLQKDGNLINNKDLLNDLGKLRTKFYLYGKKNEIYIFEEMISAIELKDTSTAINKINELASLVQSKIRDELGLNT